jgi:hypothetical protein
LAPSDLDALAVAHRWVGNSNGLGIVAWRTMAPPRPKRVTDRVPPVAFRCRLQASLNGGNANARATGAGVLPRQR